MQFASEWRDVSIQKSAISGGFAFVAMMLTALVAAADETTPAPDAPRPVFSLLTPIAGQFDIEASDTYQFIAPDSIVRRRINSSRDSAIHFVGDLGNDTMQMPAILFSYWIDEVNAVQFQSRYFAVYGSRGSKRPLFFGGTTIAPQVLSTDGTRWFTVAGFYQRRLTPLYQRYEAAWPWLLQGWDARAKIGLEFAYIDFRINDGKPATSTFAQFAARVRLHEKELPIPTVGLEARKLVTPYLAIEITAQGSWANKWNSGRNERGTVYLSQSSFETNWRLLYSDPALCGVTPFVGFNYYYFKIAETGSGVGNLLRIQQYGPQLGFMYSLQSWDVWPFTAI